MTQVVVELPPPATAGGMALAESLHLRRSVREFATGELALEQVGQLLWAAQGITADDGRRTAPSAGALYPLELYLAAGAVEQLSSGVYRFDVHHHHLVRMYAGDVRRQLADASFDQSWMKDAPAIVCCGAFHTRTSVKYGRRAERYVGIEAGHAAQNLLLQATALGLHSVIVGAFDDSEVHRVLDFANDAAPLWLIPIGT